LEYLRAGRKEEDREYLPINGQFERNYESAHPMRESASLTQIAAIKSGKMYGKPVTSGIQ